MEYSVCDMEDEVIFIVMTASGFTTYYLNEGGERIIWNQ